MPVIINELEVTAQDPAAAAPAPAAPAPAPPPSPFELRNTLRHMSSRADRLRAD